MASKPKKPAAPKTPVDWEAILAGMSRGKTNVQCATNRNVFRQGEPADSLYYLRSGKVKLTVTSEQGKEAIVAVLGAGEFFGEGCLAGQPLRVATASRCPSAASPALRRR